jgi:hypothetical protein
LVVVGFFLSLKVPLFHFIWLPKHMLTPNSGIILCWYHVKIGYLRFY